MSRTEFRGVGEGEENFGEEEKSKATKEKYRNHEKNYVSYQE